ncbi:TSUP family transporter [Brachybacterium sp. p3-SID957]|uniref:TSUP family transporter n=1 Tax=Brachybacterium sp. p3-SID957 TaxID=2916049 RepID=UPI0021E466E0|nr:TSUP family transporter [Brachybacterium sp. p3-SID957]MCT1775232.1 TSUP family transporter [Brachybacterium sp. p3-SID957]
MPLLDQLTQLTALTLVLLIGAAFLAGWVDAVVGGGGLIQLPALLTGLPGDTSTATVLGTNKLASAAGTAVSAATYVRRVMPVAATAIPLVLCALAGSAAGAALASLIPRAWMSPIVLVALIGVGTYTLLRPAMGLVHEPRHRGRSHVLRASAIGSPVGFYDGILGPGTGSFFIIAMVVVLGYGFLEASVHAKLANLTTNIGALLVFGLQGQVWWILGAVMALANITGGYLGARLALRLGSRFVRVVFLIVIAVLAARLAVDSLALLQ